MAVFNDRGEAFALDDACPHQGASLGQGVVHRGWVVCPWHSWVFEVRTGQCPRRSHEPVRSYPTRLAGGGVEVLLPDPEAGPESESE